MHDLNERTNCECSFKAFNAIASGSVKDTLDYMNETVNAQKDTNWFLPSRSISVKREGELKLNLIRRLNYMHETVSVWKDTNWFFPSRSSFVEREDKLDTRRPDASRWMDASGDARLGIT